MITHRTKKTKSSGGKGAKKSPYLGINTKSSTPPSKPLDAPASRQGARVARAMRYQAHSRARQVLGDHYRPQLKKGGYLGNFHRTIKCRFVPVGQISVNHAGAYQSAFYKGLAVCGSVWACPVCAARIQERRRLEIEQAVEWAKSEGYSLQMVTFTFPHRAWDRLGELLQGQAKAFEFLRSGSPFTRLKRAIGFQGFIRSLEVVHGQNGWHPHTHELWITGPDIGNFYQVDLVKLWERACCRAGLLLEDDPQHVAAFRCHAVDVRNVEDAGAYLAKQDDARRWGVAYEIAKASSKGGRLKGVHPHHFLIRQAPGDSARYVEYAQAMHGKRQLLWSPGLKAKCGCRDLSDAEIADEGREEADILAFLSVDEWRLVRGNDARAELLDAAETGGCAAVRAFLDSLR